MGKIVFVVVFMAIVLISYHLLTKNNKKLKRLRKEWETGDFQILDEPIQSVSSYWANKKNSQSNYDGVDQLTDIARHSYSNYHFRESIEDGEIRFDYTVHSGPSITKNAIKLLEMLGYPASVTEKANGLAQHFTERREWEEIGWG